MKIAVDAIKKSVATQGYEEAELNVHVVNIENCIASLKCHGLKKKLSDTAKRKSIMGAEVNISNGITYALYTLEKSWNVFWSDVIESWKQLAF